MSLDATRRAEQVSTGRLAALFDAHHLRLYRLARRLSGDAEEARDLVQQTFLQAARHVQALPPGEPGGEAWLVRTIVNLCKDRHRRLQVRRQAAGKLPATTTAASSPESQAVARTTVQAALARLPPRRRAVVVLHELEERTTAEIARLLGVSAVTVRWHLAAGRKSLRHLLTGVMPGQATKAPAGEAARKTSVHRLPEPGDDSHER